MVYFEHTNHINIAKSGFLQVPSTVYGCFLLISISTLCPFALKMWA